MALLDDLQRIIALQATSQRKVYAVQSAFWLFERNSKLPLDQQAQGVASLVAAALNESDISVRQCYLLIVNKIVASRPSSIGAQIDWKTLAHALPALASKDAREVLWLFGSAPAERYLTVLENAFDDMENYDRALSSWIFLAYRFRYASHEPVWSYLQEARTIIEARFLQERNRFLGKRLLLNQTQAVTKEEWLPRESWFPKGNAWARAQLAKADKRIRRQFTFPAGSISERKDKEEQAVQYAPNFWLTRVQEWLTQPMDEEELVGHLEELYNFLDHDIKCSVPVDDAARIVKLLMDYAWETTNMPVKLQVWTDIATLFQLRRYVGTYIEWEKLTDMVLHLNPNKHDPTFRVLCCVLTCFGSADDERYLAVLKPFLDHRHPNVRWAAVEEFTGLLCQLAHFCSEAIMLLLEAHDLLKSRYSAPDTPEHWQEVKERIEQFEHDVRPYFHYYSI